MGLCGRSLTVTNLVRLQRKLTIRCQCFCRKAPDNCKQENQGSRFGNSLQAVMNAALRHVCSNRINGISRLPACCTPESNLFFTTLSSQKGCLNLSNYVVKSCLNLSNYVVKRGVEVSGMKRRILYYRVRTTDVHLSEPGQLHFVQVHFTTDEVRPSSAKIFFSGT